MQILGNILPGFRDIRAPIVAGYTWLILAWVLERPNIHTRPHDQVLASLYDLGHDVGRIGIAVGVSVAAYLIGALSQGLTEPLTNLTFTSGPFGDPPIERVEAAYLRGLEAVADIAHQGIADDEAARNLQVSMSGELETRTTTARLDARRELRLPATLLVGEKPELFAEVDRLRSEGELRTTVYLPLAALFAALGVLESPWWFATWIPLSVLFVQGLVKISESRKVIADAIAQRRVGSRSQDEFDSWIDRFVGQRISTLVGVAAAPLSIISASWRTDNVQMDVASKLRDLIVDGRLEIQAENGTFGGDPEYGKVKRLDVEYSTRGRVDRATFREGDVVRLPREDDARSN